MRAHRLAARWLRVARAGVAGVGLAGVAVVGVAGVGLAGVGLAGCGRIGYDEAPLDGGDGPPDAPIAQCNAALRIATLPVPAGRTIVAFDVAATTTGFVLAWPVEDEVFTAGLRLHPDHAVEVIQSGASISPIPTAHVSIDAIGDDAVLGLDHPDASAVYFIPVDAHGYQRADVKSHDGVAAHGASFLVADPTDGDPGLFGVAGMTATETVAFERDIDSHPIVDAQPALPGIVADNASLARLGDGYALISGRNSNCDVVALDDRLVPLGASQSIDMTCHNATVLTDPATQDVVAAWNCDNDRVWITAGPLTAALPAHREVYGDDANVASNPRLAVSNAGIWYAFAVDGGRLGRALVDHTGAAIPAVSPAVVVPAGAGHHDLVTHTGFSYLFWIAPATNDLWTMRLCAR